jgi:glycerophosphoryl diester phosphodiesterase
MRIIGHRGARREAPENTIPGFRHAVDLGLTAVEFDVQLSGDGHPVVIHDATVDRTTDGTGPVSSYTLAQLQALDARDTFPHWPEPCRIPTLGEVLEVVEEMTYLLVEIRADRLERLERLVPLVIAEVRKRDLTRTVTISSIDPAALDIALETAREIPRMLNGAWRDPGLRARAIAAGCTDVDFDALATGQDHIDWARAEGMGIVGWPCEAGEDLDRLLAYGVDAVGTDRPALVQELFFRRGLSFA